jgi:hypothetical protein
MNGFVRFRFITLKSKRVVPMDLNHVWSSIRRCASAFSVVLFVSPAFANHIDFISDGGFLSASASAVTSIQLGAPGNILGSEREVSMDFVSGAGILSTGITMVPAGPGPVGAAPDTLLWLDNSVLGSGIFKLLYDGVGSAGLGGLDFDTMWDMIDVEFAAVQGTGDVSVTVTDTAANTGTLTIPVAAAGIYSFPFSNGAYAGVNFNSVNAVEVTLETTQDASDFAISQITRVVPEPTTTSLLIVAVLGLVAIKRRRRIGS